MQQKLCIGGKKRAETENQYASRKKFIDTDDDGAASDSLLLSATTLASTFLARLGFRLGFFLVSRVFLLFFFIIRRRRRRRLRLDVEVDLPPLDNASPADFFGHLEERGEGLRDLVVDEIRQLFQVPDNFLVHIRLGGHVEESCRTRSMIEHTPHCKTGQTCCYI